MSTMKVSKFSDELTYSGKLTKELVFKGKRKEKFDIKIKYYFLLCPNLLNFFSSLILGYLWKRNTLIPNGR